MQNASHANNSGEQQVQLLSIKEAHEIWDELARKTNAIMPMFSYAWYHAWIQAHPEAKPYILFINNETLAPFVIKNNILQFTHEYTDFNDIIGNKSNWTYILRYLKKMGLNNLFLENIPENSETIDYFRKNSIGQVEVLKPAPLIVLPQSFAEYLSSIREKRKKYFKFQRDFPQAKLVISQDKKRDFSQLMKLMKKNSIKNASFTRERENFFNEIFFARMQDIDLLVLVDNNQVIGVEMLFKFQSTAMLYISGFDKDTHPNAGTYFIIEAIKRYIEQGYTIFSLLKGKESYKYELGAKDFNLYTITANLSIT